MPITIRALVCAALALGASAPLAAQDSADPIDGIDLGENHQIVDGLAEGDSVLLSDMSRWDNVDRVRVK